MTNINNIEINKIIKKFTQGKLNNYSIDNIPIIKQIDIISFITKQINQSLYPIPVNTSNYKMQYYYPLFEYFVNIINKIYLDPKVTNNEEKILDQLLVDSLLLDLTLLLKGQNLLNKLLHRINKLITGTKINLFLNFAAKNGTFITFTFWLNRMTPNNIENIPNNIFDEVCISSIANSDDRLYKFILDKNIIDYQSIIYTMITTLATSNIPTKFKLKRIKYLSYKIDLVPYFKYMINSFNCEKIIYELHKYYYKVPHDYSTILILILKLIQLETNPTLDLDINKVNKLINILKTEEEKTICKIQISLLDYNHNFKINNIMEKVVINNYKLLIKQINWNDFLLSLDYNNFNKKLLSILVNNNLITKLLNDDYLNLYFLKFKVLFFTRFLIVNDTFCTSNYILSKKTIAINLLLHKLRLLAKQKKMQKMVENKAKMFDVLNEIKTFKPNKLIPVLSKGSYQYQLQKQKFNILSPQQTLPEELTKYKYFLIREKTNGITVNDLPIGIYPNNDIANFKVKAEYIEDQDLYLVYDIDIPNTTILERYNYLLSIHNYTKQYFIKNINTLNEFKIYIDNENKNIQKFINDNKHETIKWYPKFICKYKYNNDQTLYNQLINHILTSKSEFNTLIITPLDGDNEIKLKSRKLLSIYLKYYNNKWFDKNNYDWSSYINPYRITLKNNNIYKCCINGNNFDVTEYRYDKKYPDDSQTINNTIYINNIYI
jgi:hypothetical protein